MPCLVAPRFAPVMHTSHQACEHMNTGHQAHAPDNGKPALQVMVSFTDIARVSLDTFVQCLAQS